MKRSEKRRLVRDAGGDSLTHLGAVFSKSCRDGREERLPPLKALSGIYLRCNLSGTAEAMRFRLKTRRKRFLFLKKCKNLKGNIKNEVRALTN